MANQPEQENTVRRRSEILDADYVPQTEAPVTPRATGGRRSGRGVSSVTVITVCIVLLALVLAVIQGDGRGRDADAGPEILREARWNAAVIDSDAGTPAEEALGAALETLSAPVAAYYSMKDCPRVPGAQVCAVEEDGPAAEAGLVPGDVITAVNGVSVHTAEELSEELCPWDGEAVSVTVYRAGETLELTLETAEDSGG